VYGIDSARHEAYAQPHAHTGAHPDLPFLNAPLANRATMKTIPGLIPLDASLHMT